MSSTSFGKRQTTGMAYELCGMYNVVIAWLCMYRKDNG